jgi:hypothetical protein
MGTAETKTNEFDPAKHKSLGIIFDVWARDTTHAVDRTLTYLRYKSLRKLSVKPVRISVDTYLPPEQP